MRRRAPGAPFCAMVTVALAGPATAHAQPAVPLRISDVRVPEQPRDAWVATEEHGAALIRAFVEMHARGDWSYEIRGWHEVAADGVGGADTPWGARSTSVHRAAVVTDDTGARRVRLRFGSIEVEARSGEGDPAGDAGVARSRAWHHADPSRCVTRPGADLRAAIGAIIPDHLGVALDAALGGTLGRVPLIARRAPAIRWGAVERERVRPGAPASTRRRVLGESDWGAVTLEFDPADPVAGYTATVTLPGEPASRLRVAATVLDTPDAEAWRRMAPDPDAEPVGRVAQLRPPGETVGPGDPWPADLPIDWDAPGPWGIAGVCAARDLPGLRTDGAVLVFLPVGRPAGAPESGEEARLPEAFDLLLGLLDEAARTLRRSPADFEAPVDPRFGQPRWGLAVAPVFVFDRADARAASAIEVWRALVATRRDWHPDLVEAAWSFSPDSVLGRLGRVEGHPGSPRTWAATAVFVRRSGAIQRIVPVDASLGADAVATTIADTVWPWRSVPVEELDND